MITLEPTRRKPPSSSTEARTASRACVYRPLRTGLLINPRAGRSDKHVPRLRAFLRAHPEVIHAQTPAPQALPATLAALAEQEVRLLLVYGGDGTFQHVLTALLGDRAFGDRLPMIAPLRGGRTNMTALDLGAHRDPVKGIDAVLQALAHDRLHERVCLRHVLHIASRHGEVDQYGMFFGAGTIYRGIELVHRTFPEGPAQGTFGSTLVAGSLVLKRALRRHDTTILTADPFQICLDGCPIGQTDYNLVMTSTLHRLIAGIRPFWGREPAPVRFTAIAAQAEGFGRALPGMLRGHANGRLTPDGGYISHNIHRAEIDLDCGFTIDGELYAPEPGRTLVITGTDQLKFVRA